MSACVSECVYVRDTVDTSLPPAPDGTNEGTFKLAEKSLEPVGDCDCDPPPPIPLKLPLPVPLLPVLALARAARETPVTKPFSIATYRRGRGAVR